MRPTSLKLLLNYPKGVPGKGFVTINYNNLKITIFQVMGRTFMNTSLDCPFETTENLLAKVDSDIYICDFMVRQQVKKLLLPIILMEE